MWYFCTVFNIIDISISQWKVCENLLLKISGYCNHLCKKYQKPLSGTLTRAWWPSYLPTRGKLLSFFDFLWRQNPTLSFPSHLFTNFTNSFRSSLNFQISTVLSEDVCLKVFVTKSWWIYEIVQKYNFHLCRLFATGVRGGGSPFVWEFNIPPKAEDNICYGRAGLGSLLKSCVLLDPSLLLRVMNFTSALNPTERYIYWVPSPLHV